MRHPLDELFVTGLRVHGGDGRTFVHPIGEMDVPSGKLCICDPHYMENAEPFQIKPGAYAVDVAGVRLFGVDEIAATRIHLTSQVVTHWRRTRRVIGIDSATVSISDSSVPETLARDRRFEERFLEKSDTAATARRGVRKIALRLKIERNASSGEPASTVLVSAFIVHVCDGGGYRVWEGLDSQENICALAIPWARNGLSADQHQILFPVIKR